MNFSHSANNFIGVYFNQDADLLYGDLDDIVNAIVVENPPEHVFQFLGELAMLNTADVPGEELRSMLSAAHSMWHPGDPREVKVWLAGLESAIGLRLWRRLAINSSQG